MPWAHLSGSSRVLEELHPAVGFDDWKSLRWWGELGGLWGDGSWSGGIESLEGVFLSCRTRRVSNKPWLLELESKHLLYVKIQTFLLMKFPCLLFKICVVHQHLQLFWLPKVIWHPSQTSQRPGHCFWLHSWSPRHHHPRAQDLGIQLPAQWLWDILDEFVYHYQSGTPAIPGGPWQLVHSWWEHHGSDISWRYLVVFVSNIKLIDVPLAIGNPPCM